jgi:hypothetical protein
MPYHLLKCSVIVLFLCDSSSVFAEPIEGEKNESSIMDNDRLDMIIRRMDDNPEGRKGYWQFKISNLTITVITDEKADRMRIIIPITKTEKLEHDYLYRIMQANFDSTLDARYAIAKKILWSAYLHPLSSLSDDEFLMGLGQTVNLVTTFGTTYTSGLLNFSGGDSKTIQEKELIQELLDKGRAI